MEQKWTLTAIIVKDWIQHGDYMFYTDIPAIKQVVVRTDGNVMTLMSSTERLDIVAGELAQRGIPYQSKFMDQHYNTEIR